MCFINNARPCDLKCSLLLSGGLRIAVIYQSQTVWAAVEVITSTGNSINTRVAPRLHGHKGVRGECSSLDN